jgi:predicted AAA+ superfamily ATPase
MKRDFYSKLIAWKNTPGRKPLVLRGARQVGKTTLLKKFGSAEFKNVLYVNFEKTPSVKQFFDNDLHPPDILRDLGIYYDQEINPASTLIIFDEIQECPNALTSLKYFQEQASEYFIASAGSLLGVKLAKSKGFPVGKVNFLTLYPCSFFEFLNAIGKEKLRSYLEEIHSAEAIAEPIHQQLLELLRFYYYVGGMPEALNCYAQTQDLDKVRTIHREIIDAYLLDFSKHAPANEIMKLSESWGSIPSQLAKENKKFIYSNINDSARAREYESSLQWLSDAGLIHRSFCIDIPRLPIDHYSNKKLFKVFMLDVGLLSTMSQLPAKAIIHGDTLFTEFKGALTENFVAQELKVHLNTELYYWKSKSEAEVDFVLPYEGEILPLEVKSGTSTKQKSLAIYREKYHPRFATRVSLMNLRKENEFYNYPLYLVGRFPFIT